jgi:hypothetical protein
VGGLPLTSLDLSGQPLGLAGWQLLLRLMRRTNCLQRLVLSGCSIAAADAGKSGLEFYASRYDRQLAVRELPVAEICTR